MQVCVCMCVPVCVGLGRAETGITRGGEATKNLCHLLAWNYNSSSVSPSPAHATEQMIL